MTQLHYYVEAGGPRLRTLYDELGGLVADPLSLMLTAFSDANPPDYRCWVRLPNGRTFGKHAYTIEDAMRNLIYKLRRAP